MTGKGVPQVMEPQGRPLTPVEPGTLGCPPEATTRHVSTPVRSAARGRKHPIAPLGVRCSELVLGEQARELREQRDLAN